MQKTIQVFLSFAFLFFCVLSLTAQTNSNVYVSKSGDNITIGNGYINRVFSTAGGKLKTNNINNLRTEGSATVFTPGAKSEEFVVNLIKNIPSTDLHPLIKTGWTIEANSWSTTETAPNGLPQAFIDGDINTYWHTNYGTGTGPATFPYWVIIDLQTAQTFKSFTYTPRQIGETANGNLAKYEVYVSNDKTNFGTAIMTGTFTYDGVNQIHVNFPTTQTGRYVKLVGLTAGNGQSFGGGAEFDLNADVYVPQASTAPVTFPKTGWTVTANSVTSQENAPAGAVIDGDNNTYWHSNYGTGTGPTVWPFFFIIDMKQSKTINSFIYTARPTGINGIAKDYELYVSDDGVTFPAIPVSKGTLSVSNGQKAIVGLPDPASGRFVKFVILTAQSDNSGQFGTCAEFDLSPDAYIAPKTKILASDLTLANTTVNSKSVRFDFAPYNFNDVDWSISMVVEMEDGDHFMRKHLEFSVPETQQTQARIDYIDGESFETASSDITWTHPPMGGGVGGMSGYWIALGQPIYIQGMFFGSEFPQTETSISTDKMGHIRYFSGKSLAELNAEGHVLNGKFSTWKTVAGAARSTDMNVIQSDFFAYIKTIAKPTRLRTQYNSWYDWMMDINENNIQSSFYEMEKGFTQNGMPPVDSYVVDDGWNAYGPFASENTAGFWQFNSKFPNGLTPSSDFSHRVASNFGLWLGPRGGYNYNYAFAQFLEANGNGMLNDASGDITTNQKKYLQKLQAFFLDTQDKYKINYWKLDGFSTQPPTRKSDQYISGGEQGMYYMTEHWERWYNVLTSIYDKAGMQTQNMWINLTCYVNPSPWILQWSNSVWMQNSNDIGRFNTGLSRQVDQLLTYRDDLYFDFNRERQFQFPASNIYNHDPIYGKTGTNLANQMTDDEFRAYLLMMATRGSSFWELYYSYNMMDEGQKWMINAEAIDWINKNFHILRNSKLIGSTPRTGHTYGYSCWDGDNGIISVRNPSTSTKTITFTLDRNIGVREGTAALNRVTVMNFRSFTPDDNTSKFNYGQSITVTLLPGEIRIWQFSPDTDVTPAQIETVKSMTNNSVIVKFNERVKTENATFTVNGAVAQSATLMADYKTVKLTLAAELADYATTTLDIANVEDYSANKTSTSATFTCYPAGIIMQADNAAGFNTNQAIEGVADFNIAFNLNTTEKGITLFRQENDVSVSIDVAGKLIFTVKGLSIASDVVVADGMDHPISVCREKNGMLKIYIAGILHKSLYDKTKVNEPVAVGTVTVGSAIANLQVLNYALPFDALKIVEPLVRPQFSTGRTAYWYRIHDNNPGQNKMYVVNEGSYTNRLKYRSTWSNTDSELFKFVQKTTENEDDAYIYSKLDETTRISVNPVTANLIQVFNNPANDTWKIYPSKDPGAFCIQAINTPAPDNLMNSFQNSASGGIIGFWNDNNAGDAGSQWLFELMMTTNLKDISVTNLDIYTKARRIYSKNQEAKLLVYDARGLQLNPVACLTPGVYYVRVAGKTGTAKVLIQ